MKYIFIFIIFNLHNSYAQTNKVEVDTLLQYAIMAHNPTTNEYKAYGGFLKAKEGYILDTQSLNNLVCLIFKDYHSVAELNLTYLPDYLSYVTPNDYETLLKKSKTMYHIDFPLKDGFIIRLHYVMMIVEYWNLPMRFHVIDNEINVPKECYHYGYAYVLKKVLKQYKLNKRKQKNIFTLKK